MKQRSPPQWWCGGQRAHGGNRQQAADSLPTAAQREAAAQLDEHAVRHRPAHRRTQRRLNQDDRHRQFANPRMTRCSDG